MSLAVARVEMNARELSEQIEKAFMAVYAAVNRGDLHRPGLNVIVYRPGGGKEVEVECGVQVATTFPAMSEVFYRETPAGRAATTTHHGPYARLGETHATLATWVASHGLRLTGLRWEVYGEWSENPAELRVDIFHQVAEEVADEGLAKTAPDDAL